MLLRHTLLYLPAQCITPLVQFLSIIIWAHLLTPADLGMVTLMLAIQELSFSVFFTWWSHYALRFISAFDKTSRGRFIATEGAAVIVSVLVQTAITLPLLNLYFPQYMNGAGLAAGLLYLVTRSLNSYMAERARSEAKIALYTVMQVGGPLVGFLIGLGFIKLQNGGAIAVLTGFVIAQAGCLVAAALFADVGRRLPLPDRAVMSKAARFGIPVMMAGMLAILAVNAPRFIVEHLMGLEAVGHFSVGYGLGIRASSFAVMLVTAGAYPLVVRKMEREGVEAAYDQLGKNITLVALAVVPVALGLLAVNTSVVDLMVPADYRDITYLVLPVATVGGLLRGLRAHTTDQVFLIRSRTNWNTVISIVDLISAVLSSYFGLKFYGLQGAALGPMISGACTLVVSLSLAQTVLGFRAPYGPIAAIMAVAGVMAVVVALLPAGHGFVGLGLRVAAGAVIYAAGVALVLPMGRQVMFTVLGKVTALVRRPAALRSR